MAGIVLLLALNYQKLRADRLSADLASPVGSNLRQHSGAAQTFASATGCRHQTKFLKPALEGSGSALAG
jgi:hypothetical protein